MLVSGIFPPESGGPGKFAESFAKWNINRKNSVFVLAYANKHKKIEKSPLLTIHFFLRSDSIALRFSKFVWNIGLNSYRHKSILAVGAFIETYVASIIFRFEYIAKVPGDIVWERARNNKLTELRIEEFQKSKLGFKYRIFRKLYSKSLKRASSIIVPSQGLFDLCKHWGIQENRIHLVHNSVDISEFRVSMQANRKFDCLTVCRLTTWKGVDELIEYCSRRKLRLVVAGDGPERINLEKLAKNLGADVTFLGEIQKDALMRILQNSKLFVLNSYYEGLPHALVEARAAGILSVGRAGTGSAEVINDDIDGFLIRPDRGLDETLDLAFSQIPKCSVFLERAKTDTKTRFDQSTNFAHIQRILER